jgi:hypothetical protein
MGVLVNKKQAQYATSGFYAKRCNPDGTMAHGQRTLGFAGIIDISSVLDSSNIAKLQVKVGTGPWQIKAVDFSTAVPEALTVTAAVTALTAADFTGCGFSADPDTGRLLLKATDAGQTEIQIYGYLAGALNFGGGRVFEGMGCYYVDYVTKDDTVTIQPTVQKDDNERIEQEGSHGTKTTVIIAGGRNGEDLVITTKPLDFEFQQMVQGGKYKRATITDPVQYEPPLPGDPAVAGNPLLTIVKVDPLYAPNVESLEGQEVAVKTATYYAMIGSVGDESGGAKSLTQFQYNFSSGTYTDENGVQHANPLHRAYTSAQWEALNLKDLIERPIEEDAA